MTEKQMTYEVGHLLGEVVRLCHLIILAININVMTK